MKKKPILIAVVVVGILIAATILAVHFLARNRVPDTRVTAKPDISADRTLQEQPNSISINFGKCTSDVRTFNTASGSTTVQVDGKIGSECKIKYGEEVDNPNAAGSLDILCAVPASYGTKQYRKLNEGVDLSPLGTLCSNASGG